MKLFPQKWVLMPKGPMPPTENAQEVVGGSSPWHGHGHRSPFYNDSAVFIEQSLCSGTFKVFKHSTAEGQRKLSIREGQIHGISHDTLQQRVALSSNFDGFLRQVDGIPLGSIKQAIDEARRGGRTAAHLENSD
jgi:hypothetical protein